MSILLSHTTALEALRRWELRGRLARGERCAAQPPPAPPSSSELDALARRVPLLAVLPRPLEVLVYEGRSGVRGDVRASLQRTPLPAGSSFDLGHGVLCASPEQLAVEMASRLTELELVLLLSELMGLYAVAPSTEDGMYQREAPLTTPEQTRAYLAALGPRPGVARVRRALGRACVRSGSPRETKLSLRLALKPALGGYHLNALSMNDPVTVRRIHDRMEEGVRKPDILLGSPDGERVVAVEYHGRRHEGALRVAQDAARTNELKARGIGEFVVRKEQYDDIDYLDGLVAAIRRELGLPRIGMTSAQAALRRERRQALYEELEHIDGVTWGGRAREAERERRRLAADPEAEGLAEYESARAVVPVEAYGLG